MPPPGRFRPATSSASITSAAPYWSAPSSRNGSFRARSSIDHGAKIDLATLKNELIDRGGCINLIAPAPTEKYGPGKEIKIPEMNVTGFLVEAGKIDVSEIVASTGIGQGSTVPE